MQLEQLETLTVTLGQQTTVLFDMKNKLADMSVPITL